MNVPAILFMGAAVMTAVLTGWLAVEAYLLWAGLRPETWYLRNTVSWHAAGAVLAVGVFGLLLGAGITHFVLDVGEHAG